MKKIKALAIAIIALSFILGAYFYPQMPAKVATHWNASGEADGYMTKIWGVFLLPLIALGLLLLFFLIPHIDPLGKNISKFQKYFDGLLLVITLFFVYIYTLTIAWNLGYRFDMAKFIIPGMGFLIYYMGILISNAKRNWFIGIRTPWTLSSDRVWDKTHNLGGKLFKACGALAFLGIFFEKYSILFVIIPLLITSIFLIAFSYFAYKKFIN